MRKLLVTGGTGFIGSHLAESALKQGHKVAVLGMTDIESDAANAKMLQALGAEVYSGSITDKKLCQDAMQDVTHVYHLAVAMREAGISDAHFEEVNLEGTRHLLEIAVQRSVERFVYCGTIGIFGHRFDGVANEESPKRPGNIYEKTKLAAEQLALRFYAETSLPVVVLRPADVYGPRDQRLKKLYKLIAATKFPLFGSGSGRRHMVYIDDVVTAFETACEVDSAVGKTFIVAGPEVCTLRQMIDKIASAYGVTRFGFQLPLWPMLIAAAAVEDLCTLIGVSPPIYRRRMDFFTSDSAFCLRHAREVLGWSPKIYLDDGIRRTISANMADDKQ